LRKSIWMKTSLYTIFPNTLTFGPSCKRYT
jgi:hypothetical protein